MGNLGGMPLFVITGATSGIGRATASALAARGRKVMAVGRSGEGLRMLTDGYPACLQTVCADLSTASGINTVVEALQSCAKIDGLVHAAGSAVALSSYQDFDAEALSHHMSVHVAAPIALNNRLRAKLEGTRIVYLDSYSANAPRGGWATYSIVKAAARMSARAAAAEMPESTVIRVFPGGVRTPLVEAVLASTVPGETVEAFRKMQAEGKMAEPEEVGAYLADILLRASDEQTGSRESWDFNNPEDRIFS